MKSIVTIVVLTTLVWGLEFQSAGTIRGTVRGSGNQELLPMSLIFLYSSDNSVPARSFHTRTGNFTMVGVPSGIYQAFVSHEGYRSILTQEVYVKADTVTDLTFLLRPIRTRSDSTDVVQPGQPGVDYRMKYFKPDIKKFR
jgi:hypothetical protein